MAENRNFDDLALRLEEKVYASEKGVIRLKKGINGQLISHKKASSGPRKLTPPGGLSGKEIQNVLNRQPGQILLQSGIRVFQGFFLQWQPPGIDSEGWLEQERQYYRQSPFNSLGEHTHFLWIKGTAPVSRRGNPSV